MTSSFEQEIEVWKFGRKDTRIKGFSSMCEDKLDGAEKMRAHIESLGIDQYAYNAHAEIKRLNRELARLKEVLNG